MALPKITSPGDLFGGAVNDIFGGLASFDTAKGYKSVAGAYRDSAKLYGEQGQIYGQMGDLSVTNASVAAASQRIKEVQTQRGINGVLGGQKADIAAAGLEQSGSALDILRDSANQGSLQMSVLRSNGVLEQQGYKEEQLSYQAMQKASGAQAAAALGQAGQADAEASASKKGGLGKIAGTALKVGLAIFSDMRLKEDITFQDRRDDGIGHYLFRYRGGDTWYLGVLAQEVMDVYPEAVSLHEGFLKVDYGMIGDAMYAVGSC